MFHCSQIYKWLHKTQIDKCTLYMYTKWYYILQYMQFVINTRRAPHLSIQGALVNINIKPVALRIVRMQSTTVA